ncbi:hypothetical protein SAMN05660748_4063 [Blastococcus aggregatus]|uniref:Uncharacterized protein n=1 Tax=Blastococcus aggregatus TaxID=38502 RepID=A0A285VIL6_9ACTN|nr:hypothetical protein SAMN05660748_4063 [Blastococcus aggregatus]
MRTDVQPRGGAAGRRSTWLERRRSGSSSARHPVVGQPPPRGRQVAVHSCVEPGGRRNPSSGGTGTGHRPAPASTHREVVPRHVHSLGRSLTEPVRDVTPVLDGGSHAAPATPADPRLTWGYVVTGRPEVAAGSSRRSRACSGVHRGWGRTGGNQGSAGGRGAAAVHGGRVVHVSTTDRRSPPTSGQQGWWGPDLRKGPRSPASTRVMTKMRYFYPNFLEPHSGWGRSPGQASRSLDSSTRCGRWSTHRGTGFPPEGTQQAP